VKLKVTFYLKENKMSVVWEITGYNDCYKVQYVHTFLMWYEKRYPDCIVTPLAQYRLRNFHSDDVKDTTFNEKHNILWNNPNDLQSYYEILPGHDCNATYKNPSKEFMFTAEFKLNPTIVGTELGVLKFCEGFIKFNCYEDMKEIMLIYASEFGKTIKDDSSSILCATISEDSWNHTRVKNVQSLDQIFIKSSTMNTIKERIKGFQDEKERCARFGKPSKLNFLFYGIPGAGKTSLAKAIAKYLDRTIYILSFSKELTDQKLNKLIKQVASDSIILLEDVDSFFMNRESQCNLSFSALINQLDGVQNADKNLITILTANHTEKLDSALLRQGRVDLLVKFDYPGKEEVKMAFDLYMDHLQEIERNDLFKIWYPLVKGKDIPMSAFTDLFFRNYKNLVEKTDEFLKEYYHLKNLQTNANSEKMYL
jgi:hypothetical protein